MSKRILMRFISIGVLSVLLTLLTFFGVLNYALATPNAQDNEQVLLYSKLEWERVGSESKALSIDQGASFFSLPGTQYKSKGITKKPSADIVDYYSQKNMSTLGWGLVGSDAGGLMVIQTYFKEPNSYLVVTMGGCYMKPAEVQPAPGFAPEFCVWVWRSGYNGAVPIPKIQPFPEELSKSSPTVLNYSNPLPVPTFSQNDGTWKADRMGWPDPSYPRACDYCTLGYVDNGHTGYGCWTTAYSMLYNYYSSNHTNPRSLNNNLNSGSSGPKYALGADHCGNLMPGGSPYSPSGVSRRDSGIYNACTQPNCIDSGNVPLIQNEINAGRPVLVYVHFSGTSPQHMVVITGYSGSVWYVNDPWDGGRRTLSSGALGAYVVDYIYRWNGTPPGGSSCSAPSLIDPSDGATLSGHTITFRWNALSECTFNGYTFRVKDTSNMDSGGTTLKDTGEGGTQRTETIDGHENQDLYWGVRAANAPNGANWAVRRFRIGSSPSCSNPNAGGDEIVLFSNTGYGGNCRHLGIGDYGDAGQLSPVGNDDAESIKVGSNVKAILYENGGFGGINDTFTSDDTNLNDNTIKSMTSSVRVQTRSTSTGKWHAEYYPNSNWSGSSQCPEDFDGPNIDRDWQNRSPCGSIPSDNFTGRFTGTFNFSGGGAYWFHVNHDDGAILWIDGGNPFQTWTGSGDDCPRKDLGPGNHTLRIDYREDYGGARINLDVRTSDCVQPPSAPTLKTPADGSSQPHDYNLKFEWNSSSGASEYLVEWWGGPYSVMQPCSWTSDTFCPVGPIAPGYTYSWHVKARNGAGESGWSNTWKFSILANDTDKPTASFIYPVKGGYINANQVNVQVSASDQTSGVKEIQFFAGYYNGTNSDWRHFGTDTDGSNGWQVTWDSSGVTEQLIAFAVIVFDQVGNRGDASIDNVTLDRTPPASSVLALPSSSLPNFGVTWSGTDNFAGITSFDVQYQDGAGGAWTDWKTNTISVAAQFQGQSGHTYLFRSRARDKASNVEEWPASADAQTSIPSGPPAFHKLTPEDGKPDRPTSPTLNWELNTGATGYEYCIDTIDDNQCGSNWTNVGTLTSKTVTGLAAASTFFWQIRAYNATGSTEADSGDWWSFTTTSAIVVGPGRYENNHAAITYTGTWTNVNLKDASGGSYHKSTQPLATASIVVSGATSFKITSSMAGNRGIANVLVDGKKVNEIDACGATAYKKPFGPYPLADTGQHTITLEASGRKNPACSNITVTLDNFVIIPEGVTPPPTTPAPTGCKDKRFENTSAAITYAGTWTHVNLAAASGKSYRKSNEPGATASLLVNGARGFKVTTSTAPNRGIANVLIDGVIKGTIDAYGATAYKVPFGYFDLPDTGPHTIALQVSGTRNSKSNNIIVTLDNFVVCIGSTSTTPTVIPTTPGGTPTTPTAVPTTPVPTTKKRYENDDPAMSYAGNWTHVNLANASGGNYRKSTEVNAAASLVVSGATSFKITSSTAGNRGIAKVLVDGALVGTLDACGATAYKVPFGPYPLGDTGQHTITLQVTGTKNPGCSNFTVTLDNIVLTFP